jgi:hypothetical protein
MYCHSVSYQSMRRWQRRGVKPLGQCCLIRQDGHQTAREGGDCQHRGGRELG